MFKASELSKRIEDSKTLAVTTKVAEMRRKGISVIDLGAGEPDFQTPEEVREAGIRAIRDGYTKYTPVVGIFELREAIADFLQQCGGNYSPEEIVVSNGAKHAIYNALLAACNPGDEVIIPAPYWTSYPQQVRLVGAKPVILPASEESGFKIAPEALREAINPRTRMLLFNSPSNPTGAVYTRQEIERLVEVIAESGILVLSDEIYFKLVYDGLETVSLAAFADIRQQLLLVNGVSKSHAMTGWRLGYLAAKAPFIQAAKKIQSHTTSNASSISQYAALAALRMDEAKLKSMYRTFAARRDFIYEQLCTLEGMQLDRPQGAFYAFPNVSVYLHRKRNGQSISTTMNLASFLLEEAHVALVPGDAFGAERNIRISYANSMQNLQTAISGIREALGRLSD